MIIDTEECAMCRCFTPETAGTMFMGYSVEQKVVFICFECQDKSKTPM